MQSSESGTKLQILQYENVGINLCSPTPTLPNVFFTIQIPTKIGIVWIPPSLILFEHAIVCPIRNLVSRVR